MLPWAMPALLAAVVLLVYYPVAGHRFLLWDDTVHVSENPHLFDTAFFWTAAYQGIYMPLTYSVWSLTARLAGLGAMPFHMINAGLHLACTILVFFLLRRLLGRGPEGKEGQLGVDLGAGLGALLFALHPVQVEPVSWITSLKDMASGLFALTALFFHVRRVQEGSGRRDQVLAIAAFLCAMLCKPVTVSVILMAGVISLLVIKQRPARIARDLLPYCLTAAPLLLLTARAQGRLTMLYESPLALRPLIALDSLGFYLWKLFFPLEILPAYGRSARLVVESGQIFWSWIPGALCLAGALVLRKRLPTLLPALLLFISGFVLVSGLLPFAAQDNTTVYDRYLYLAMLGPALLLGHLVSRTSRNTAVLALAALVLLALGIKSGRQTRHWRDDVSLWSFTLEHRPQSPVALINLGFARNQQGRKGEALALYRQAVRAAPKDPQARNNLGALLAEQGKLDLAGQEFKASLAADPNNIDAHHNMGRLHLKKGRLTRAEEHLTRVLRRRPRHPAAALDLGEVYLRGQKLKDCVAHMREVAVWHPGADAPLLLGVALAQSGDLTGAVAAFRRTIARDPSNAMARANLNRALKDIK